MFNYNKILSMYIPDVFDNEVGADKDMVLLGQNCSGRVTDRHVADNVTILQVDACNLNAQAGVKNVHVYVTCTCQYIAL